jgi:hypothetical protein
VTLLAYAVVHDETPIVYAAENADVLHRVLALKVVARTRGSDLGPGMAEYVRDALLDERWGDAVVAWINHTGIPIDVYGNDLQVWTAEMLGDPELGLAELQFTPLFEE